MRPGLEYSCQVWSPYMVKDILKIEKVQNYMTRRLCVLCHLGHPEPNERNRILGLESLELRRIKFDLVMIYKIIFKEVALDFHEFFEWAPQLRTRHRCFKLLLPRTRLSVHSNSFACRLVRVWNELPEFVTVARRPGGCHQLLPLIRAQNCRLFKARLEKIDLPKIITKVSYGKRIL